VTDQFVLRSDVKLSARACLLLGAIRKHNGRGDLPTYPELAKELGWEPEDTGRRVSTGHGYESP
jgi:hypothetical protein